jgi:hypothetical protein
MEKQRPISMLDMPMYEGGPSMNQAQRMVNYIHSRFLEAQPIQRAYWDAERALSAAMHFGLDPWEISWK